MGVRRVLGATTNDVAGLVVMSALRVIGGGAVVGLILAAGFSRLIVSVLLEVQPLDLVTFGAVTAILVSAAAVCVAGRHGDRLILRRWLRTKQGGNTVPGLPSHDHLSFRPFR